mgnify:CR=1 FL=1
MIFTPASSQYHVYAIRAHEEAGRPSAPDPEGMNAQRIGWAVATVAKFQKLTRTDHEDALTDLLCDLRHLAFHLSGSREYFDHVDRMAAASFEEETEGGTQ